MKSLQRPLLAALIAAATIVTVGVRLESADPPITRTYVGTATCAGCHTTQYGPNSDYKGFAAFQQTMHQQIHKRPSPQTVIIENYFAGDSILKVYLPKVTIPGKDTLFIHLSKSSDGRDYFIQLKIAEGDTTPPMKVAYTYGGNGWIMRYLVEIAGHHYVAPFQYILPGYRNRSATGGGFYYLDMNRWLEIETNTGIARLFAFNTNSFRSASWDRACSPCHVTGSDVKPIINGSDTGWTNAWVGRAEGDSAKTDQNVLIGCENCHGPGSEHASDPSQDNIINPKKWSTAQTDLKLDLCGNCHYRVKSSQKVYNYPYDDANKKHYVPGQSLRGFIDDWFSGENTWPDRQTSYAHHQTGQDYRHSKMYQAHVHNNGCWDCHTVHSNTPGLPYQLNKNWYTMETGEGCLSCHTGKEQTANVGGRTINVHTKHPQVASACVNCHMTKTASIGFLDIPGNEYFEFSKRLYEFSNHSFRVLKPSMTREYASTSIGVGMINSCAEGCHRNGRGSRNSNDSVPAAPTWGISDNLYGLWNEPSDLRLADTLQYFYDRMFGSTVAVPSESAGLVTRLVTVSPNPFAVETTIRFVVGADDDATLEIFTSRGERVAILTKSVQGEYVFEWNGTDMSGRRVANGTYFIRLKGRATVAEQRVVIER